MDIRVMPDIKDYQDLDTAASDPRVPYTAQWLRKLAREGRIEAEKYGTGRRAMWLIHMPSLLAYVEEMKQLGPQKFVG